MATTLLDVPLVERVKMALAINDPVAAANLIQEALDSVEKENTLLSLRDQALDTQAKTLKAQAADDLQTQTEDLRRLRVKTEEEVARCRHQEAEASERLAEVARQEASLTQRLQAADAQAQALEQRRVELDQLAATLQARQDALAQTATERKELDRLRDEHLALRDAEDARQAKERNAISLLWASVHAAQSKAEDLLAQAATDQAIAASTRKEAERILTQSQIAQAAASEEASRLSGELSKQRQALANDSAIVIAQQRENTDRAASLETQIQGVSKAILDAEILQGKVQKARRMVKAIVEAGGLRPKLSELVSSEELEAVLG